MVAAVALCIQHSQTITLISDFTVHVSAKKLNTKQKYLFSHKEIWSASERTQVFFFFADEALKKLGGPAFPFLRLRGWLATTVVHNQWRVFNARTSNTSPIIHTCIRRMCVKKNPTHVAFFFTVTLHRDVSKPVPHVSRMTKVPNGRWSFSGI